MKQESPETNTGLSVVEQSPKQQAAWTDIKLYLKPGAKLYTVAPLCRWGAPPQPRYTFTQEEFEALSDLAPIDFWSPSEAQTPKQLE